MGLNLKVYVPAFVPVTAVTVDAAPLLYDRVAVIFAESNPEIRVCALPLNVLLDAVGLFTLTISPVSRPAAEAADLRLR